MNRRFNAVSLQQAAQDSPSLASLAARAKEATDRLQAVQDLIPPNLRTAVKAGPAEGQVWTLLVEGNAAAAKLRQLVPLLTARLISKGWSPVTLRIKLLARRGA